MMGYEFKVDGKSFDITPENAVANLFRHYPYYDYITYKNEEGKHTAIYSSRLTRWIGGIALTQETRKELYEIQTDLGVYAELFGGHPRVIIDDYPTEEEYEMLAKTDLDHLEEWINGESE